MTEAGSRSLPLRLLVIEQLRCLNRSLGRDLYREPALPDPESGRGCEAPSGARQVESSDETLDAYRAGLDLVRWIVARPGATAMPSRSHRQALLERILLKLSRMWAPSSRACRFPQSETWRAIKVSRKAAIKALPQHQRMSKLEGTRGARFYQVGLAAGYAVAGSSLAFLDSATTLDSSSLGMSS